MKALKFKLNWLFFLLLFSCTAKNPSGPEIREDILVWIHSEYGKDPSAEKILSNMAKVGLGSCDFRFYSQCLEKHLGEKFMQAEMDLISRLVDTKERAEATIANIKECSPAQDDERRLSCF